MADCLFQLKRKTSYYILYALTCFDFFFVSSVGLLSSWKCFLYFGIVCASASIQHVSQSHTGTQVFEIEIWFGICHRTVCLSHSHTGVNPYRCCRFFLALKEEHRCIVQFPWSSCGHLKGHNGTYYCRASGKVKYL